MFCGGQVVPHKIADGIGPCDDVQAGCEGHQQRHAAAVAYVAEWTEKAVHYITVSQ